MFLLRFIYAIHFTCYIFIIIFLLFRNIRIFSLVMHLGHVGEDKCCFRKKNYSWQIPTEEGFYQKSGIYYRIALFLPCLVSSKLSFILENSEDTVRQTRNVLKFEFHFNFKRIDIQRSKHRHIHPQRFTFLGEKLLLILPWKVSYKIRIQRHLFVDPFECVH